MNYTQDTKGGDADVADAYEMKRLTGMTAAAG
jgi:hypothetical protein